MARNILFLEIYQVRKVTEVKLPSSEIVSFAYCVIKLKDPPIPKTRRIP